MTVTTNYGSWCDLGRQFSVSVEDTVAGAFSNADPEWIARVEASGAFEEMVDAYRAAINEMLPEGVSLCGNEFYGPYEGQEELIVQVPDIVGEVSLAEIIERFDPDNRDYSEFVPEILALADRRGIGLTVHEIYRANGQALQLGQSGWAVSLIRAQNCEGCGQTVMPPAVRVEGDINSKDEWVISAEWDRQHGCGTWNTPTNLFVPVDADPEVVIAALMQIHDHEMNELRAKMTKRLGRDLDDVLSDLEAGNDPWGLSRNEYEPGVILADGELVSWDYDPGRDGDIVEVRRELSAELLARATAALFDDELGELR